jgi:signal peptidase II
MRKLFPFLVAGSIVGLDRLLKGWAMNTLPLGVPRPLIGDVIRLTRVHNVGGAFGIFQQNGLLFLVVSALVGCGLIALLAARPPRGVWAPLGLSIILGGAIGNLIDRLTYGPVIDFFEIRGFPVFNLADACVTVGTGLVLIHMLFGGDRHRSRGQADRL